jgi:ABC-type dipeptide/oligopeptide/nickel transport system permease subunit
MRRRINLPVLCGGLLSLVVLAGLFAPQLARCPYDLQFRDAINAPPSAHFPLGTDELGRDRLSRLLYGTRVSILLAPAAAFLSVLVAALAGALAAWRRGRIEQLFLAVADLTLSVPWFFLLLTLRAMLPLDAPPSLTLVATFSLLGLLGWAGPARAVRQTAGEALRSSYALYAQSRGVGPFRLLLRHILPNLRPVLVAQFWTALPVFVLAEANLGMIGLGIPEPLPSWGTLLHDLASQAVQGKLDTSWWLLVPAALVVSVVLLMRGLVPSEARS